MTERSDYSATAVASPNIAFIKYWGNINEELRLPVNGSLSMNMDGLATTTQIRFSSEFSQDSLELNGRPIQGPALGRVINVLNAIRAEAGTPLFAMVTSENNFPSGAGIASSASAFAALAFAAVNALGMRASTERISRFARLGSGSASRSVPDGFVEWYSGDSHETSFASSIAAADHWDLADCVLVVSDSHKKTGSTEGHKLAPSSPLQAARVSDAPRRIEICRQAILERDFEQLSEIIQLDSDLMHAVMMTSHPALFYWTPETLRIIESVRNFHAEGLPVAYTIDAGPNVHLITEEKNVEQVISAFKNLDGIKKILTTRAGNGAHLV